MRREDVELLAPAGTWEALEAAVFAGADAVYLGGSAFGARAYAENFGPEELQRAITLLTCTMFVSMSRSIPLSLMRK